MPEMMRLHDRNTKMQEAPPWASSSRIFWMVFSGSIIFILLTIHIANSEIYSSIFDDGMISFRYARNISSGVGPYWNEGDKIEGITNPLWTYFLSFIYLATGSRENIAPLAVQITCGLMLATNCMLFSVIAKNFRSKAIAKGFKSLYANFFYLGASFSPVLFYPNIYWTLMGMENALLSLLASAIFVVIFKSSLLGSDEPIFKKLNEQYLVFAFCLLGQLTRPDFLLIPISLLFSKFITCPKSLRKSLVRPTLFAVFGILSGILIVHLWRLYYYDASVPNTYLLKVEGVNLTTQIISGFGFLRAFFKWNLPFIAISLMVMRLSNRGNRQLLTSSLTYLSVVILYQIRVGGDPWSYWRAFTSSLTLLGFSTFLTLLLLEFNSIQIPKFLQRIRILFRSTIFFSSCILALSLLLANISFIKSDLVKPLSQSATGSKFFGVYTVNDNRNNIDTARSLARILPKGSMIGVFWAGTIPYYLEDYYAVDFLGKSDEYIASLSDRGGISWNGMLTVPGHNKYDLKWTMENYKPDWIQYSQWGKDDLTKDPSFASRYKYCEPTSGYLKKEFMDKCN